MNAIACGIDIGTTNLKVVLVDGNGRAIAQEARPTPRLDEAGAAVTSAPILLELLESMIVAAWTRSGASAPIAAICSAGVGEDGMLVSDDLAALGHAIPWYDRRAATEAQELHQAHAMEDRTGLTFEPTRTAAKWLWLSRHSPAWDRSATWLALTDYPLAAWSGRPFMSETLAARTGCYDVQARKWISRLLDATQAPLLPAVLPASSVVGKMLPGRLIGSGAVSPETLLVAGGHDHPVAASFVRRFAADAIVDSLGTAELIHAETAGAPAMPAPGLVRTVPVLGGAGQALLLVFELANALEPFSTAPEWPGVIETVSRRDFPSGAGETPWLPTREAIGDLKLRLQNANAAARQALLPSVLEGCGFVTRSVVAEMRAAGVPHGPIHCSGGWSRSDALMALRANFLGETLYRVSEEEQAALGAALIALAGCSGDAATDLSHVAIRRFDPDPEMSARHAIRFSRREAGFRALRLPAPRPRS